jgi:magnesium transporter
MVDAIFPLLDRVLEQVEQVEEAVLERPKQADFQQLFRMKRALVTMRRVIRPLRDSMAILSRSGDPRIDARTALYFRDLHDHVVLAHEIIEEGLDFASNAMEAYRSAVSSRTNEVIKSLTVMSAIFLPLSFLVGFWGQNFEALPFGSTAHFGAMLAMIVAVPVALFGWFRLKGWLTEG